MKVYLCGPIMGCTDSECNDWRKEVKTALPNTLDPMDRDYRGREDVAYKEIVELDKLDIMKSDALLVNFPFPSVGTCMEILFAWEQRKLIAIVAPPNIKISPWLKYHANGIFTSFEDAVGWLVNGFPETYGT